MDTNTIVMLVSIATFAVFTAFVGRIAIKREIEFLKSLPTLEEAQKRIAFDYPGYTDCFKLTKKVTDTIHGEWGARVNFYGDFLVCEELGVSIQVRLD